ncbi:hypothetical protein CcrMagneto_gp262 [Caulobacter virus Magneto]|uniref:hypothetical protein n=1 Tax=Caulobacter virus Magneto TaxID=1211642 RepID=UPI00028AFCFA|nr:hypothetical protein CcrMagneto_gp262 [Caulobacter virus Magneto]AFU87432.1 hypothetical protein CcrMagneto_gp262 [Caulobacter virus Magneto]
MTATRQEIKDVLDRVANLREPDREVELAVWNIVSTQGRWAWHTHHETIHQIASDGRYGYGICSLERLTSSINDVLSFAHYADLHSLELLEKGLARVKLLPRHLYDQDYDVQFFLCRDMLMVILEHCLEKANA